MRVSRQITDAQSDPYAGLRWKKVDVEVCHADAAQRVCLTDIEVPAHWSYAAAETFARYYIRRTGVPKALVSVREEGVPSWLWRSVPDTAALHALPEGERYRHERSAREVFGRLAGMWTYWGFKAGYFDTEDDAHAFHDEMCALLARQVVAPNSPQWFNAGLHWAYGMTGPAQGHFHVDLETGRLRRSLNAYERPQLHACFLHGVKDDLLNEGGIMHLFEREARAFKYGSGAGTNMSAIRGAGEGLSSGASALGLMRFLNVGDKAAGSIHAGGLPRRAGKMVVVDIDHPDVMHFIRWKGEEQYKAAALITGARVMKKHLTGVMAAISQMEGEQRYNPAQNGALKQAMARARRAMIPQAAIERVIAYARQGFTEMHIPVYSATQDSEVFFTVAAHQTRQAVRIDDRFMEAVAHDEQFAFRKRTDGGVADKASAQSILEDLAHAVWATGEPTLHFADSIARGNSCPEAGEIRAATPASEYLFLDDTACPLAAINLLACADAKGNLDLALFSHVVRLSTLMLDISVTVAQYPSREMARHTLQTRPIGLGLANMAPLFLRAGMAYDSTAARTTAAHLCALLTGEAAVTSADMAKEMGTFSAFTPNRRTMLEQIATRRDALADAESALADAARRVWEMAMIKTEAYGARNAQLSCVPPTSTIARVMDCETLGLAPIAQLVRYAPQPGGSLRKQLSANVSYGLQGLGLNAEQLQAVTQHVCGHGSLQHAPGVSHMELRAKGFGDGELMAVEEALQDATDIHAAFDPWDLGERFCREQLKITSSQMFDAQFKVLEHLGFSSAEIAAANRYACGGGTLEGAPHVAEAAQAWFHTASGERRVRAEAQIAMMAACQPFLTGGIAHTILLPHGTSVDTCRDLISEAWRSGLKTVSFYREGCALYDDVALPEEEEQDETLVFRESKASLSGTISEVAASLAHQWLHSRRELPMRQHGFTQKANIGGQVVYLRTGEYAEGTLGEVHLDLPQEAPRERQLAKHFAQSLSLALQYGVPLSAFVESFTSAGHGLMDEHSPLMEYVFGELANAYMSEAEPEAPTQVIPFAKVL